MRFYAIKVPRLLRGFVKGIFGLFIRH
ncbi:MAG: stage V sporulation protein M [Firmicutes bacterium]|nr:stage V sporulation protein M [Bacillota bacterium]